MYRSLLLFIKSDFEQKSEFPTLLFCCQGNRQFFLLFSATQHIPTGHVSFPPIIEDDNDYSKLWTEIWTSIVKKGEDPGKEKHVHEKLQKGDHIKQRKKKKKVDEQQKKVSKLHVFILFTMKRRRYKIKSE